jgi:hypothetical protein
MVLNGFLELGLDPWLLVGNKTGSHPRVISFYASPFFDDRPYADSPVTKEIERRRGIDQLLGIEDFNHPYSHQISEMTGASLARHVGEGKKLAASVQGRFSLPEAPGRPQQAISATVVGTRTKQQPASMAETCSIQSLVRDWNGHEILGSLRP